MRLLLFLPLFAVAIWQANAACPSVIHSSGDNTPPPPPPPAEETTQPPTTPPPPGEETTQPPTTAPPAEGDACSTDDVCADRLDMMTGNEVLMLRRVDGTTEPTNFNLDWATMESEIGDQDSNYWVGLNTLYETTYLGGYWGLKVELTDWDDNCLVSYYRTIMVDGGGDNYWLTVDGYMDCSTGGDGLLGAPSADLIHTGMQFSSSSHDHDNSPEKCTDVHNAAWWFNNCAYTNPLGTYLDGGQESPQGITWGAAPGYPDNYSFKYIAFTLLEKSDI